MFKILVIWLILITNVHAESPNNWTIIGPSKDPNKTSQYNFDNALYTHFNQLQTVTVDPNGSRIGNIGDLVLYNNGVTYITMVETTSPKGKTWQAVAAGGGGSGNVGIGTTGRLAIYTGTTTVGSIGTPTACSAGSYTTGIDVSGNSTGCTVAGTGKVNSGNSGSIAYYPLTATTVDDLSIISTNLGGIRVGVQPGVTAIANVLHVNGNVGIGTSGGFLTPGDGNFNSSSVWIQGNVGIGTWAFTGGRLIVLGGNVGIGSLSPGTALDVVGTTRSVGFQVGGNVGINTTGATCNCTRIEAGICTSGSCT